jgi:spore germination protein KC
MKKTFILLYIFLLMPLCTACWDYREVNQMTIVAGLAVDKTFNGDYLLTFEAVDLQGVQSDKPVKSVLIESQGETLMDAIRNTISKDFPKLYFGHTTVVILSREIAEDGVLKIVDFLFRDAEPRLNINLYVSEEKTANEIMKYKPSMSEILSVELTNILDEQKNLAKALLVPAYKFVNAVAEEGVSAVLPSLCIVDNVDGKTVKLCGTAIFKGDKLQGFISDEETYALSFILDEVKGGVIVTNIESETEEKALSLEIMESSTNIKPVYSDNKLSVEVNIDTKTFLNENMSTKSFGDEQNREEVKKNAENQLKDRIERLIEKMQKGYGADVFGFGNSVYKNIPKLWKEKWEEWDIIFRDLDVTVNINIEIEHTGLLSDSLKLGD